jgi:hypothetical protein
MSADFEERFLEMCEVLGSTPDVVAKAIGRPDEETVNEAGTRFLYYSDRKALFIVDSETGIAKYLECPITDVHGSRPSVPDQTTTLAGVRIGDSRARVREVWGPASTEATYVWVYSNRRGTTKAGAAYQLAVSFFSSGASENSPVLGFEGRLIHEEQKAVSYEKVAIGWLAAGPSEARDQGSTDALAGTAANPPGNWFEDYMRGYASMQNLMREDLLRKNHGGCVVTLIVSGAAILAAMQMARFV